MEDVTFEDLLERDKSQTIDEENIPKCSSKFTNQ